MSTTTLAPVTPPADPAAVRSHGVRLGHRLDSRPPQAGARHAPQPVTPVWSPWADRRRPSTIAEELTFRADLGALTVDSGVAPVDDLRRADITAMLNALRCALSVGELLERAPGLRPGRLAGAYDLIDGHRRVAVAAWDTIATSRRPDALDLHGAGAARLVPRLVTVLDGVRRSDPSAYDAVLSELVESVEIADRAAAAVEIRLQAMADGTEPLVRVGRLLDEADGHGVASWPTHLPRRVTTLSPLRVAALLGE